MFCNRTYKTGDLATWCLLYCCCGFGQTGSVGVFFPEIWKNYLAGVTFFFSSLEGWLSCSVLIGFPIPWVIFKLPLLTCHRIVQRQCRHSGTNSKISLSFALQLCFCPQLLALACNTTLRSMVTTCAGKSRYPSTQQGPSTCEKQWAWEMEFQH